MENVAKNNSEEKVYLCGLNQGKQILIVCQLAGDKINDSNVHSAYLT